METIEESAVGPTVDAAPRDEMIFYICAKGILFILFRCKNVLSSSVLVLVLLCACAFCLRTMCALYFRASRWEIWAEDA